MGPRGPMCRGGDTGGTGSGRPLSGIFGIWGAFVVGNGLGAGGSRELKVCIDLGVDEGYVLIISLRIFGILWVL